MNDFELRTLFNAEVLALCRKLSARQRLSEHGAWLLTKLFHRNPAPATIQMRMEKLDRRSDFVPDGSLIFLALDWKKDPQTIRRWCQKGLLDPEAYQTKGGQWRVPYQPNSLVQFPRLKGFIRRPKNLLLSKRWKEVRIFLEEFNKTTKLALDVDAIEQEIANYYELKVPPRRIKPSHLAFVLASKQEHKARLVCAVNKLKMSNEDLTWTKIAQKLGISRATLHRLYGKAALRKAIARARKNIVPSEPPKESEETDELFEEAALKGGHRKRTTTNPKR